MSPNRSLRSLEQNSAVSRPIASRRSSVSRSSAPRGTAIVRPSPLTGRPLRPDGRTAPQSHPPLALFPGQGDVQPVDRQREADSGQWAAKAAEQVVVAPAAAERRAERRVVDVEDRARVVAEVANEAEVEDHARGDLRREQLVPAPQSRQRIGERAFSAVEHIWPAAQLWHPQEQLGVALAEAGTPE